MLIEKLGQRLSCRDASRLISQGQDRSLPWFQALTLRMHLRLCALCARFDVQLRFLREAMQRYRE